VEMPLVQTTTTILLPRMADSDFASQKRVAETSLTRLLVVKRGNRMIPRIVTLVPTPEYAAAKNYDISSNRLDALDAHFSGYIMVREWSEKMVNIVKVQNGKMRQVNIERRLNASVSNTASRLNCTYVWVPQVHHNCVVIPTGDQPPNPNECSEWSNAESPVYGHWEQVCVDDGGDGDTPNFCTLYGIGCNGDDGNGGGDAYENTTETDYSPNGLKCSSFTYRNTASNWQEAGVSGLRFKMVWIGGSNSGIEISVTLGAPLIFGLPIQRADGTIYSPGKAAEMSAEAVSYATALTAQMLKYEPYIPSTLTVETMFKNNIKLFMLNYAGTAGATGSGSPEIVTKPAKYQIFGHGDCE
jgi:hypothetical protein